MRHSARKQNKNRYSQSTLIWAASPLAAQVELPHYMAAPKDESSADSPAAFSKNEVIMMGAEVQIGYGVSGVLRNSDVTLDERGTVRYAQR